MKKIIIVSGGNIDKCFIKQNIKQLEHDYLIAVDKGLEILDQLDILPTHIVGDFDSIDKNILNKYQNLTNIHQFDAKKDVTDTNIAINLALSLKADEIIIFGATGSRIDHMLANIQNMKLALDRQIPCKMIDTHNEIFLINKDTKVTLNDCQSNHYLYISILPLTIVTGLTLSGFKYQLNNYTLAIGESIGISNELLKEGLIKLKSGILIVIKSRD